MLQAPRYLNPALALSNSRAAFLTLPRYAFLGQRVVLFFSSGESQGALYSQHYQDRESWSVRERQKVFTSLQHKAATA